jgi:hypothetical protein
MESINKNSETIILSSAREDAARFNRYESTYTFFTKSQLEDYKETHAAWEVSCNCFVFEKCPEEILKDVKVVYFDASGYEQMR